MKSLKIEYLKKATKFLKKNSSYINRDDIETLIVKAIKKIVYKEDINIDVKALQAEFSSFYRIRKGKVRILFEYLDGEVIITAIVSDIDFRGNIYK